MDFRTIVNQETFGVRATALIVRDGKILLTERDGLYYTIGGAIEVGESTCDAVKREVFEELGIEVVVKDLAFIVENFFAEGNRNWHNIEFHYLVEPLTEPPSQMMEDQMEQACYWVDIKELADYAIVPTFLKKELPRWEGQLVHIAYGDRED